MAKFITIFMIAGRSLLVNKLRSILTILGIVIGVSAVIAMLSIGQGVQHMIDGQLNSLGTNLLFVLPSGTSLAGIQRESGTMGTLTMGDAEALADPINAPAVEAVAPILNASGQAVYGDENARPRIIGTTPEFEFVRNSPVSSGEFFQASHIASRSNVALLGTSVREKLFGDEDPLNKWIRINNVPFRVIGILQKKGATGFVDQDDVILVPITTVQSRLIDVNTTPSPNPVTGINIQVVSADQMDDAIEQIGAVLRKRHRIRYDDDFDIIGQDEVVRTANQVVGVFTFFLGSVAAISLVVGGIGIMNIMLVSVTERTREIGIRKAVGATHLDILIQFLSEAIILTNAGGLIGILLGLGLTSVISQVDIGGMTINPVIEINTISLAMGFSTMIGVIFGLYPARHAAHLNPIEALRYE